MEKTTVDDKKRKEEDDYWDSWDPAKENGVGCRCRCDKEIPDVEGKEGSCLAEWVDVAGDYGLICHNEPHANSHRRMGFAMIVDHK